MHDTLILGLAKAIDLIPTIFEWMNAVTLLIFAPMAIFRRSRHIAATAFMIATPIFAFLLWASSAVTVYAYQGLWPVIFSTLGLGVGTVISATVSIITSGTKQELLGLAIMIVVTGGSGFAAFTLAGHGEGNVTKGEQETIASLIKNAFAAPEGHLQLANAESFLIGELERNRFNTERAIEVYTFAIDNGVWAWVKKLNLGKFVYREYRRTGLNKKYAIELTEKFKKGRFGYAPIEDQRPPRRFLRYLLGT